MRYSDKFDHEDRRSGRRRYTLLAGTLACAALLVTTACSSSAKPAAAASPTASASSALLMSECMRSHGVPNFPDPNSQGGVTLNPGDGVNPNSSTYESAMNYCEQKYGQSGKTSPAQQATMLADNLKYAACMRTEGVKDFPDPNSEGQFQIKAPPGSDLDPSSPAFVKANKVCAKYQYSAPGGSGPQLSQQGS